MRRLQTRLYAYIAAVLFCSPVWAQEWNYPAPPVDRDPADISFYQQSKLELPKISASRPRRIILCIGDGMGFNHIALARHRASGAGGRLHMEQLPVCARLRTCSADSVVTDSAAAATAIACGIKTDNGMIGMSPDHQPCSSILELLDKKGWRTGLVVTSTISHATPAAFASHVESRGAEADIAAQMLNSGADVLFGGGYMYWTDRKDGRDLLVEAQQNGVQVVRHREQLHALRSAPAIGLFADKEMTTYEPEPSLAEMMGKGLELLSAKSEEWFAPEPRFFLMVEGSEIDWAAHDHNGDNVVRQLLLFDMAAKEAIQFAAADKQTLVIVIADHETGGLALIKGQSGPGPEARWTTKGHTAADVPLFAYGPGAERFARASDNTDVFDILAQLTRVDPSRSAESEPSSGRVPAALKISN